MEQLEQPTDFNKLSLDKCYYLVIEFFKLVDFEEELTDWFINFKIENKTQELEAYLKFIKFYNLSTPFTQYLDEMIEYPNLGSRYKKYVVNDLGLKLSNKRKKE